MDYDGTDQRQLTRLNSDSMTPAVSPSADMFAFTTYPAEVSAGVPHDGNPRIAVFSSKTGRRLTFLNPSSSLVTTPEFAPDGRRLFFVAAFEEGGGQVVLIQFAGRRVSPHFP